MADPTNALSKMIYGADKGGGKTAAFIVFLSVTDKDLMECRVIRNLVLIKTLKSMKKIITSLALLLFAVSQSVLAQRTITGKAISAEDGLPMPGVYVSVKETAATTITNTAGNFSITVPNNRATIVVSFVGFKTVEIPVGNNTQFTITLQPDPIALGDVVVSARRNNEPEKVVTVFGIERNINSLPYAVYQVSGDELTKFGTSSFQSILANKVPTLSVRKMGQGAGATEVISGRLGIINLYVIDGVPFEIIRRRDSFGMNMEIDDSILSSINIHDIETVTVLMSSNAAMLYGSAGAHGAIVITLKKQ